MLDLHTNKSTTKLGIVGFNSPGCDPTVNRLPNVVMIGAAKAGTTFLASLLGYHPQLHLPRPKEPEFFSFDENYARGLQWYRELYKNAGDARWVLDASTGYTRYPEVPHAAQRLHAAIPSAKLIYLMRHPIERAYSHYIHRWSKELYYDQPFRVSFEQHVEKDTLCVNSSDYQLQLSQYRSLFSDENILCLFSHELKRDQPAVLRRVCEFLDVDYQESYFRRPQGRDNESSEFLENRIRDTVISRVKSVPGMSTALRLMPQRLRETGYRIVRSSSLAKTAETAFTPMPMLPETRKNLLDRFYQSNRWLEQYAGVDLSCWEN